MNQTSGPLLHALLVGIDAYPPGESADGARIEPLSGCVRDALEMYRFLVASGADPRRVRLLTSPPVDSQGAPRQAPVPTKANLVAALREVLAVARPGEQALFHFSGHGTFLRTAFPEIKSAHGGYDAALVPCDGTRGDRPLLRDVELAHLLREFVAKGVFVTVILDSCHCGGLGFRKPVPGLGRTRIARQLCAGVRPLGDEVASRAELLATWDWWCKPAAALRSWWPNWQTGDGGWLPTPRGYVLLAACRADQLAREVELDDGSHQGLLTHLLLTSLRGGGRHLSYDELHARVEAGAVDREIDQSPQREGETQRRVLDGALRPSLSAIRTLRRDDRRLLLNAGAVHGLKTGTRLRTTGAAGGRVACVVDVEAERAWVELEGEGEKAAASTAAERLPLWVVEDPGESDLRSAVRLPAVDRGAEAGSLMTLLAREIASGRHPFLRLAERDEPATFELTCERGGDLAIRGAGGAVLTALPGPASRRRPSDLLRRLGHLARFRNVERLRNPVELADLAGRVELVAELVEDEAALGEPTPRTVPLPRRQGVYQVRVGQPVCLKLRNRSRRDLYCAVLDLRPDFSVTVLYPPPTGRTTHLLERGPRSATEHCVVIRAGLPDGYREGRDVLKLLACVRPSDFRWLEMEPLGADALRSVPARLPDDALQALLVRRVVDPLRGHDDGAPPADEWATAQVETFIRAG